MFQNYVKIAARNLVKNVSYSFINIAGLALGIACSILLALGVYRDLHYDSFYQHPERIFRLFHYEQTSEGERIGTSQPLPLTPALKRDLPQMQYVSRFATNTPTTLKYGGNVFQEVPTLVDADFLSIFSLNFLQGSATSALGELNNIVVSKDVADKLFGLDCEAVGKQITVLLNGQYMPFVVSGVFANLPSNSSLELSMLLRIEHLPWYEQSQHRWDNYSVDTFVMLKEGVSTHEVEARLQPFAEQYHAGNISSKKSSGVQPRSDGRYYDYRLQPLQDFRFDSMLDKSGMAKAPLYTAIAVICLILLIASINFINLSIARSFTRAREIGIRKTIGATRKQIILQFLGESVFIVVIAFVVGIALAELLIPQFKNLFNINLSLVLDGGWRENLVFWGVMTSLFALLALASGAYPALYVSSLQTTHTLKNASAGLSPSRLRSVLVVVQFTIASCLIACAVVMYQQIHYMQNKPLGFNRAYVVMIPTGDGANGRTILDKFRSVLQGNANIISISSGTKPIGRGLDGSSTTSRSFWDYNGGTVGGQVLGINFDYIETMQIPLLAGRTFQKAQIASDTLESIIVNEIAARQIWNLLPEQERKRRASDGEFSPEAILGVSIPRTSNLTPDSPDYEPPMTIIGVTDNYHIESLRQKIEPVLHVLWSGYKANYIYVRIRAEHTAETMNAMQEAWKRVAPDMPWQGSFLDENIERLYRSVARRTHLVMTATSIAILLSCMGLFALAAIIITQRTKEIGIRKVLGASESGIVGLLSRDFLKLVGIAIVIATPCAWWLMQMYLQNFAYKIDLSWISFVCAGLGAIVIAFLTVAGQAIRAARANPVDALRSE